MKTIAPQIFVRRGFKSLAPKVRSDLRTRWVTRCFTFHFSPLTWPRIGYRLFESQAVRAANLASGHKLVEESTWIENLALSSI